MNDFLRKIIIMLVSFLKKIKNYSISRIFKILANILILNSRKFYDNYDLLEDAELKIFSQTGEDGIIDFIITKLGLKKPTFVEIGVGNYSEANTRFIYETYYSQGLIVDINKNLKEKVSTNVNLWRGNLKVLEKNISHENIDFTIPGFKI